MPKKAIASIDENAWESIEYTDAVFDEATGRWMPWAEVAEIPLTAFTSRKKAEHVTGRVIVRRIPELNTTAGPEQVTLFDTWRLPGRPGALLRRPPSEPDVRLSPHPAQANP